MTTDTFNSGSGNWTVPTGVTSVQIELWGGGGGGGAGGSGSGSNGASGGGGGAYCKKNSLTVTPGQTIAYVVGIGGLYGTYGVNRGNGFDNGGTGGTTTVAGGTYSAGGGIGGLNGEEDNTVATLGGTASGGDTNTTGGSSTAVASGQNGGAGGASPNGGSGGAGGGSGGAAAVSGNAPGGGGGGGAKPEENGANGAAGRVTFTYTVASGSTFNETATGGALVGGVSLISGADIVASGGALINGVVSMSGVTNLTSTGGINIGGGTNSNIYDEVGTGGAVVGGISYLWFRMKSTTLFASGNGVNETYSGGAADYTVTYDYDDGTYAVFTGANVSTFYPLTDPPEDFFEAQFVRIYLRGAAFAVPDSKQLYSVQLFLNDEITPITSELLVDGPHTWFYTYDFEATNIDYTTRDYWVGAKLKIKTDGGTNSYLVSQFFVNVTYSLRDPTTYNEVGGGGVVAGGRISKISSSSLFTGTGGVVASGVSPIGFYYYNTSIAPIILGGIFNIEGGGTTCGGHAPLNGAIYDETASGGVVCGGLNQAGFPISYTITGSVILGGTPVAEGPIGYVNWCATTNTITCGCRVMDFDITGELNIGGVSTITQERIGQANLTIGGKTKIGLNGSGGLNWLIPLGDVRRNPYEIVNGLGTAGTNLYRKNGVFCLPSSEFKSDEESNVLIEADTIAEGQDWALSFWVRTANRFVQRALFSRGNYVPLTTTGNSLKISVGHYGQVVLAATDIAGNRYETISLATLNDEYWKHVAISVRDNVITLYINGVEQTEVELTYPLGGSNGNSIGIHEGRSFPDCHLQEFRCYNHYKSEEYFLAETNNFCNYSNFVKVSEPV